MKLNFIFLSILLCLLYACERSNEKIKSTNEKYQKEIESLKFKLTTSQKTIDSLIQHEKVKQKKNNLLDWKPSDKEILFRFIINTMDLENNSILEATYNYCSYFEKNDTNYRIGPGFTQCINRKSEFIKEYFGDEEINLIIRLLEKNNLYLYSKIEIMVEGLLTTYEEFQKNPELLVKASHCKDDEYKYYELLKSIYSSDAELISSMIDDHPRCDKLFVLYSFWVRRYSEGNIEIVHELMKKIHSKLSVVNRIDFLDIDEERCISKIMGENYSTDDFDEKMFNFLMLELKVHQFSFEEFIAYHPIFIPRDYTFDEECFTSIHYSDRGISTPDYMCKLNKLYSNFERTSENISKVFNENMLDHIASLFNYRILRKDYKVYGVLKGLLMTYEEMGDEECENFYLLLQEDNYQEIKKYVENMISDKVRNYFSDTPAGHYDRYFYLYSFWARRYAEGNKDTVFELLNSLDKKIQ